MKEEICSPLNISKRLREVNNKTEAIRFINDFNHLAIVDVPVTNVEIKSMGIGNEIALTISLLKKKYNIEGESN